MTEKLICVVLLAIFSIVNVQAQDKFITQCKVGISKGFAESIVQTKPTDANVDFMNYVYRYPLLLEDSYTGISAYVWFLNRVEIDFKAQMQYHINMNNIKASITYFPNKNLGYTIGFARYEQVFTGFYTFPFTENEGSYYLIADKGIKLRFFDRAVYSGIIVRKAINRFEIEGKLNAGACIFSPINLSFYVKQKDNNLIQKNVYQIIETWYGFVQPELMLSYDIFKTTNFDLGIEWKASSFFSNRVVDYNKTIYVWISDNYTSLRISPESHFYLRYEWDLGIYIKW